jgi:molybdopterin-guanine dinucleotide biosynthesis protein A
LDAPAGIGPIGGLCALLEHANARVRSGRAQGEAQAQGSAASSVLAVACDLPRVTAQLVERLAREAPSALVLAPRDPVTGKWQPLFARYASHAVLPAVRSAIEAGTRSMQTVLRSLEVTELPLTDAERAALHDWDTPEDL